MPATALDAHSANDAVWRIESPKLIAGLTRITGDIGLAEDLAQDALVVALERWPQSGVPDNPAAWLMATAKHRAIDQLRRGKMLDRKHEQLGHELDAGRDRALPDLDAAIDDPIGDDLLRLMFIACHPVLSTEARVALTLRLLGGLTTDEIARAFLVPESTVAQRIVRAKRTLREARVPFEVPRGTELTARLASVLEVIYLVFNEGYSATAGDEWVRPALCDDALRLARILAELVPDEPEVHGLVALLEIQASRLRARVGPGGEPTLLPAPARSRGAQLLAGRQPAAHEQLVPARAVLIRQQDGLTAGPDARAQARRLDLEQRHEAVNLGLVRHQLGEDPGQPEGVVAQRRPHPLVAGGRRVAFVEHEIEDFEHRREARRELSPAGDLERDARLAQGSLGADNALGDGRLGHEKRPGDLVGGKPAQEAQRERHARLGREHRVARDEHEAQQVVADGVVDGGVEIRYARFPAVFELVTELLVLMVEHLAPAQLVDGAM